MAVTAKDVQTLREKTGVGMMDCKKALVASDGDMDKAIEFLREKGLAAATKKADRIAAEGIVSGYYDEENQAGVLVEVNSETDFVAKNEEFQNFVLNIAKTIAKANPKDVETLLDVKLAGSDRTVLENLQDKILSIGENLKIRRFSVMNGTVSIYIHGGGTVGVMVNIETSASAENSEAIRTMGKNIAMQIAAMNPLYLDRDSVPADIVEYEKGIISAQLKEDEKMAGKPQNVLDGIIKGKIAKYFKEICLVEQQYVKEGEINVEQYVDTVSKEIGSPIKLLGFVRFAKGEGLQKKEDNFANEVAGMIN